MLDFAEFQGKKFKELKARPLRIEVQVRVFIFGSTLVKETETENQKRRLLSQFRRARIGAASKSFHSKST